MSFIRSIFVKNGLLLTIRSFTLFLIFFLWICEMNAANRTYTMTQTTTNELISILQSSYLDSTLMNDSVVERLSSNSSTLTNSTQILLLALDQLGIVFSWNTGDCTIPTSVASQISLAINVINPICFVKEWTDITLMPTNMLQLTLTTEELVSAAQTLMQQYNLHYFSMISDSNELFYSYLAQQFTVGLMSTALYTLDKYLNVSDILNYSMTQLTQLKSRVLFVICSYSDEQRLYSFIVQNSISGVTYIFLRWSQFHSSYYTSSFSLNFIENNNLSPTYLRSLNSTSFSILHLLPMDIGNTYSQLLTNLNQILLLNQTSFASVDSIVYILHELEGVLYLNQQGSGQSSATTDLGNISLSNRIRLFNYYLVGINCNGTWTPFKMISNNLTWISLDGNICTKMVWPGVDSSTTVTDQSGWNILRIVLFSLLGVVVACVIALITVLVIRSQLARKQMSRGPNKIILLPDDLIFVMPKGSIFTSRINLKAEAHERSNISIRSEEIQSGNTARYNGDLVEVKKLNIGPLSLRTKTMKELRMLKDLRHENVNTFIGIFIDQQMPALIYEYGHRGSLEDILKKEEIKLDWNFKWSMLNDLVRGMRYLSHSPIKCHGNLKSRNCVVDSRWVLKVTDYRMNEIYVLQNSPRIVDMSDLLWSAPEHVRTAIIKGDIATVTTSSIAGDVYSFGIIMQEVILRGAPFCMLDLTATEIIAKIRKPPPLLRPSVSKQTAPPEYINSMKQCWAEQPETRPTFADLAQSIKSLNGGKKVNIVDTMFKMLEQYSNNLEELIRERTTQLEEEKKKTDKLLSQMLPPTVAESLKSGTTVEAEWFEMVTIYFSDIVGFTTISALSGPMEVVDLLNDLYTMFDSILEDFDCYKVETIGDAYMVVSGLPIRNGIRHASEIATMALTLLHHCGKFKIRHMPGVPLRLRIGLHSGACVAGVVGLKMPRYCLFGDTVNTASRMESTSMAFRVHMSETTAGLLEEIGGFKLEFRGITEIKGRGNYKTYWLQGQEGFDKELPEAVISEDNHGLDKELVKLVEKQAKELDEVQLLKKSEMVSKQTKNNNVEVHVKSISEVRPTDITETQTKITVAEATKSRTDRIDTVASGNTDTNSPAKTADLLRFTPPPTTPSTRPPPPTTPPALPPPPSSVQQHRVKFMQQQTVSSSSNTNHTSGKLQNGNGSILNRRVSKAKW